MKIKNIKEIPSEILIYSIGGNYDGFALPVLGDNNYPWTPDTYCRAALDEMGDTGTNPEEWACDSGWRNAEWSERSGMYIDVQGGNWEEDEITFLPYEFPVE